MLLVMVVKVSGPMSPLTSKASLNRLGVRYLSELCGRSQLYFSLQLSRVHPTLLSVLNQVVLRHSSRSLPWKLSACPYCMGRSGWMLTRPASFNSAKRSCAFRSGLGS